MKREPLSQVRIVSLHPTLLSRCVHPPWPAHCICCSSGYRVRPGPFLRALWGVKLSIWKATYPYIPSPDIPLTWVYRANQKDLCRQFSLSLYHDCSWHIYVYMCMNLHMQGCISYFIPEMIRSRWSKFWKWCWPATKPALVPMPTEPALWLSCCSI